MTLGCRCSLKGVRNLGKNVMADPKDEGIQNPGSGSPEPISSRSASARGTSRTKNTKRTRPLSPPSAGIRSLSQATYQDNNRLRLFAGQIDPIGPQHLVCALADSCNEAWRITPSLVQLVKSGHQLRLYPMDRAWSGPAKLLIPPKLKVGARNKPSVQQVKRRDRHYVQDKVAGSLDQHDAVIGNDVAMARPQRR